MSKRVNVLGAEYRIISSTDDEHPHLKTHDGYMDWTMREIVVNPMKSSDNDDEVKNIKRANARVLRHEIIHAFLFESGLAYDAGWAVNEEMVDYFARQFPKLLKAFEEVGAL